MRRLLILVLCVLPRLAFSSEEDWLGDESAGVHLGVHYGVFEGDSESRAVNATIPFFNRGQLHGFYSENRSNNTDATRESRQIGIFLNSDPFEEYSWGLGYEESGRSSDLETEDISIYLQYTTDDLWGFRVKVIDGKSSLNIKGLNPEIENQFSALGLYTIDRKGISLSSNVEGNNWGVQLSLGYFEYNDVGSEGRQDVEELRTLLVDSTVREGLRALYQRYLESGYSESDAYRSTFFTYFLLQSEIRSSIDRYVDDHFGLDQKNILSNHDASLDYYWLHDNLTLSAGLYVYESYVEKEYAAQIYTGLNYQVSKTASFGILLSYLDESAEVYGEFSIGLDW